MAGVCLGFVVQTGVIGGGFDSRGGGVGKEAGMGGAVVGVWVCRIYIRASATLYRVFFNLDTFQSFISLAF